MSVRGLCVRGGAMGSCGIFLCSRLCRNGRDCDFVCVCVVVFDGRSCLSLQNVRHVSSVCMIVRSPLNLRAVSGSVTKARIRSHELKDGTICSSAPWSESSLRLAQVQ